MNGKMTNQGGRGLRALGGIACLAALLLPALPAAAQTAKFQFSVGTQEIEVAYDAIQTTDGGYATVGSIAAATTAPEDIYIRKFGPHHLVQWSRRIVGNGRDVGYSIRQTRDGGYIIGAETTSIVAAPLGVVLIRLDPAGNTMWSWAYAGSSFIEFPAGVAARQAPDGGFILAGRYRANANAALQGLLIRTDPNGFPLWEKVYSLGVAGAFSDVGFNDLVLPDSTANTDFVVGGRATTPLAGGRVEALFMRVNTAGAVLSCRTVTDGGAVFTADGIDVAPGGKVLFSGHNLAGAAPFQTLVTGLLDPVFNPLWVRFIDGFGNGYAAIHSVESENIIIGGNFTLTDAAMVKFDRAGTFLGGMRYGLQPQSVSRGNGVAVFDCHRGYMLAGATTMLPNWGQGDEYLVKTDLSLDSGCRQQPFGAAQQRPQLLNGWQPQVTDIQGLTQFFPAIAFDARINVYCFNPGCVADVDDGSGTGIPDGGVTIDDLLYYLALFSSGAICADIDDGSGTGTPDGGVTIDDLLYYLAHFSAGC